MQPEALVENDVNTTIATSDRDLWTGAAFENTTLQQDIIDDVSTYADTTQSGNPHPDLYDPTCVITFNQFEARPVQAGMFAPLPVNK